MTKILTVISALTFSLLASANAQKITGSGIVDYAFGPGQDQGPGPGPQPGPGPGPGPQPGLPPNPCEHLFSTLTDGQKDTLKQMAYNFEQSNIDLEASLKKAALTYGHTVNDKSSTKADATAAQAQVLSAGSAKIQAGSKMDLDVLYDVLTVDQRDDGFACTMFMKAHGPHGPCPQPGPGHHPAP